MDLDLDLGGFTLIYIDLRGYTWIYVDLHSMIFMDLY